MIGFAQSRNLFVGIFNWIFWGDERMDPWHTADWHGSPSLPQFACNTWSDGFFHCDHGTSSIRTTTLTHRTIFDGSPTTTTPHSLGSCAGPRSLSAAQPFVLLLIIASDQTHSTWSSKTHSTYSITVVSFLLFTLIQYPAYF